jgi:hypothetical protein
VLGDLLAGLLGGWLGAVGGERGRRRRNEQAFEDGRDVVFPGWVLGGLSYCHPPGGVLVVQPAGLFWSPDSFGKWPRRSLPVESLRLNTVRARNGADVKQMPQHWRVAECADTGQPVLLACAEGDMRYVEQVLRPRELP